MAPESAPLPADEPLVVLKRAGIVESVHRGRYVFCDPNGEVVGGVGDVEGRFYPRSSLKPFQAMPLIASGAADAFGLTDEELAVACASHKGEERHVAVVSSLLRKAGLNEGDLDNGAHPPTSSEAADVLVRAGEATRRIHGNCSGKHAGMVAVCRHMGWDTEGYRSPEHPLQVWIRSIISKACDVREDDIGAGIDGCGAPAFSLPLKGLATGFARLASGENLPEELSAAALRLSAAMRKHPFLVSGSGGFDTAVMENSSLVVKGGADGVWAAGSPDGTGFAMKISDGSARAVRPAAIAALRERGVEVGLEGDTVVHDLHGEVAGELVSCETRNGRNP